MQKTDLKFTLEDAQAASDAWGFNCGPAAIAAIVGMTPAELRPRLFDFEKKHYTNPKLMYKILNGLCVEYRTISNLWPAWGLVRVQWMGPWTEADRPAEERSRHSHWIGSYIDAMDNVLVFDVNCLCVGGWVVLPEWRDQVVPWLLKQVEPTAYGTWYPTHIFEITPNR